MTRQNAESSPSRKARIAGGLWLIVIVTASFGIVTLAGLIVDDDPAATARTILANESLYRLSFLADFVAGLSYLGVTLLLYELMKPVSRSLSILAAFFGLGGVAFAGPYYLSRLVPLVLLSSDEYQSVITPGQLQAMAMVSLKLFGVTFSMSMVFFGIQCFIVGYLIIRSSFLPTLLGVLLAIGGTTYIVSSLVKFLSPEIGAALSPFIVPAGLAGEGSVTLWFLARGVDVNRWTEQARA